MTDKELEKEDSNLSNILIVSINTLKKNDYMLFDNHPCKIIEYKSVKVGKHGHSKINLIGIDIFTGKKYEDSIPSGHNVNIPQIKKSELIVINCDDEDYLSLMDCNGIIREDIKCPNQTENDILITEKIKNLINSGKQIFVTLLEVMNKEKIIDVNIQK